MLVGVILTVPLAHIAGIPVEETLMSAGPFALVVFGAGVASVRDVLSRRRREHDRRRGPTGGAGGAGGPP
jgi:predicted alpha/beta-hydrolase family hydrolase